jgi:hypothetical protein
MLLYRRLKAVSPVPDKVNRLEVLPAPLAETKGEYCRAVQCSVVAERSGLAPTTRVQTASAPSLRKSVPRVYIGDVERAPVHVHVYLSKIWGFHGTDYEECYLLGCYAVWLL